MSVWAACFVHPKTAYSREFSTNDPPILHAGNYSFKTHADKRTTPSLCLKPDGASQTWYVDLYEDNGYDHGLRVRYNNKTYSAGRFELFYEETTFNTCQTVQLPKGFYCVDVLGGRGGNGGNGNSGNVSSDLKQNCFEVNQTTTVQVFRGGDGNNGQFNPSGNVRSGGGGGASGVPSLFAMGNNVLVSQGGSGGNGGVGRDYDGNNRNCGSGGGGNVNGGGNGANGYINYATNSSFFICGAGGGGAVSGTGGTEKKETKLLVFTYTANAGGNATSSGGGAGGAASRSTSSKAGGAGGNNTSFTCANTTLVSYGGGGGGGVASRYNVVNAVDLVGGAGGSGTTNSSSSSYVRIYRFE